MVFCLDHGMLAIAYDTEKGDAWILPTRLFAPNNIPVTNMDSLEVGVIAYNGWISSMQQKDQIPNMS